MLRPYDRWPWDREHVQCPRLPRRSGRLGDAAPHERIEQARFAGVGAADECDFAERGIEHDVGPWERAAEHQIDRVGQASFFWRGRSVTSRGARPVVTHSALIATSRTSSRLGSSNMISVIISSRMARKPRAPVPRLMPFWAI